MEVHHHPDFHHKKKNFKEYFLEFLMIFLAVTMGFFAEQLREHYVEIKTEEKYVQSLYNDLKMDTLLIQRAVDEKKWVIDKFDSVEKIIASNDISKNNEFVYYAEKYVTFNDVFTSQNITYQEMKSSGGFRYLKNIELYKELADYYNLYSRYQSVDGSFGYQHEGINETLDLEAKMFNAKDLASLDNNNAHTFYDLALRPDGEKFEPIITDKQSLNLLYLRIHHAKWRASASKLFLGWLKDKATELINDLKKEYQLQ